MAAMRRLRKVAHSRRKTAMKMTDEAKATASKKVAKTVSSSHAITTKQSYKGYWRTIKKWYELNCEELCRPLQESSFSKSYDSQ